MLLQKMPLDRHENVISICPWSISGPVVLQRNRTSHETGIIARYGPSLRVDAQTRISKICISVPERPDGLVLFSCRMKIHSCMDSNYCWILSGL